MQITTDVREIFENCPAWYYLSFVCSFRILHSFCLIFTSFAKKMLVSSKMVFIETEAALLCVTMWERAMALAATI